MIAQTKSNESVKTKIQSRDVTLGGPLLNMCMDPSDLNLNQLDVGLDTNNLLLLDSDNLLVDNLLNDNVKDLDHFNFEIDDNQKQYVCDICLKQFNKVRLLIIHLRHHTGDFFCFKCLKVKYSKYFSFSKIFFILHVTDFLP